ncbi:MULTISPECIES: DUF2798 domain-containing protein [Cupriavidus]|uniref:DUF2798 domain-containing protein n=2 Tax=Cupriavidus pinatubonensis TaxID=248026 RepID=Q46X68_CUPPJ|nr:MULTISPECIES: DUF2798 domain-containing protein [Cupriavidus]QYY31118.1 DUF2798 domain-containing protein [Cupriavidus pinatubonensis]TPQ31616.1 DUF2798 domain-containing protein [Cupriavidus pinatubonensis]CAG9181172.1 hypothetical protein LMG23994_04599 [Cupriavidus pinatubonensis]
MIPSKYAPQLFSLVLSGLMSLIVAGISTYRAVGLVPDFAGIWAGTWLTAWIVAFPAVLVVTPVARRAVQILVVKES